MIVGVGLFAQGMPQGEMSSSVPELDAFHDVIMPMWHSAYPNKDYAALRDLAKDVPPGVAKIAGARLPGILRDKEAVWTKGVADPGLLPTPTPRLPPGRTMLAARRPKPCTRDTKVCSPRASCPEGDGRLHKVLYVVNHKYLPEKHWDAICNASADLLTKSEAIAKATLPVRLQSRTDTFKKASEGLVADAKQLAGICGARKQAEIEKAVESLHLRYQGLEKIFE
jgi:hypothetical protein